MKNLFLLLIVTVTLCSCFASTRYVRIEVTGKGSYNPLLGSINIEQGGISIYKAVSNDDKMIAPEGFFEKIETEHYTKFINKEAIGELKNESSF